MRTVLSAKSARQNGNSILSRVSHFFLVDLIPMVLLLAMMAYGMAWLAERVQEPCGVEIVTIGAEHG